MTAIIRKGNTVCGFLNALFCNRVSLFMVKEKPKSFVKKKQTCLPTQLIRLQYIRHTGPFLMSLYLYIVYIPVIDLVF